MDYVAIVTGPEREEGKMSSGTIKYNERMHSSAPGKPSGCGHMSLSGLLTRP